MQMECSPVWLGNLSKLVGSKGNQNLPGLGPHQQALLCPLKTTMVDIQNGLEPKPI